MEPLVYNKTDTNQEGNGVIMKLTEYLHDQLAFLDGQLHEAKEQNNETMAYLVDSKISEVKLILEAIQKGIID